MTNLLTTQRPIAALTAVQNQVELSCDAWASLLSLAAVCTPALADECVVEMIQDGAELRRATVSDGHVSVQVADPLPTTRELMLTQSPSLVTDHLVAVPVTSAPESAPYVGVVTFRRSAGAAQDVCELLRELVRRTNADINRMQLAQELTFERERSANLKVALASNREIGMAMGIVIERLGCTPDDAFTTLRRASQDANRKLRDIAADIVLTGNVPGLVRGVPATARPEQRELVEAS